MNIEFIISFCIVLFFVLSLVISFIIISKKDKSIVNKEYSINIYDLNGKIIMSFVAFNVEGNDITIFYEDKEGKQKIIYVPNDAIVTIEEI